MGVAVGTIGGGETGGIMGVGVPPVAVFTGIEGGVGSEGMRREGIREGKREVLEDEEGVRRGRGIVTTTRIEQSYI